MTHRTSEASTASLSVIPDIGPDGEPQVLLVTPGPATVLTQGAATDLITQLVAAVRPLTQGPPRQR